MDRDYQVHYRPALQLYEPIYACRYKKVLAEGQNLLTTIILECTDSQRPVSSNIGWSRSLDLSCSEKLYLYWNLLLFFYGGPC